MEPRTSQTEWDGYESADGSQREEEAFSKRFRDNEAA